MKSNTNIFSIAILGFSVFLGMLFSNFFLDHSLGASVPVFVLTLILGVLVLKFLKKGVQGFNLYDLLYIPLFLLSLFFVWHQTPMLLFLDGLVIAFFFLPITYFSLDSKIFQRFSFLNAHLVYMHNSVAGLLGTPKFLKGLFGASKSIETKNRRTRAIFMNVLVGCIISVPLIIIFAGLFALADDAFKDLLSKQDIDISGTHIFTSIIVALIALYSLIGIFMSSLRQLNVNQEYKVDRDKGISSIITGVVLTMLNLLFLSFIVVQFVYLFGDHDKIVDLGLTYSEYAVRGFWELQVVSVLAFVVVYLLKRFTVSKSFKAKAFIRGSIALFIINVLIVIFSAHTRMNIYENGYGYTELRLYTHTFMFFEAALFLYILVSNFYRPIFRYFSVYVFLVGFAFLFGLNALRPDAIIAQRNIDRYHEGRRLDVKYLLSLSSDSYLKLRDVDFETKDIYYCELTQKRDELKENYDSWKEFNFSKHKAIDELEELKGTYDKDFCDKLVEEEVQRTLDQYSRLIEDQEFEAAQEYWAKDVEQTSLVEYIPERFRLDSYDFDVEVNSDYQTWEFKFVGGETKEDYYYYSDFGDYLLISAELNYGNKKDDTICQDDYITVDLVNGALRLRNSSILPLYAEEGTYSNVQYEIERIKFLADNPGTYSNCTTW